jgi:hypothetical protein
MVQRSSERVIGEHVGCGGEVVRERDLGDRCKRCGLSSRQWSWDRALNPRKPEEVKVVRK